MSKVIKSFSLDMETVRILEDYCSASDNWDGTISRSRIVDNAIKWYLSGDTAELVESQQALMAKVRELAKSRDFPKVKIPWWRRILIGR